MRCICLLVASTALATAIPHGALKEDGGHDGPISRSLLRDLLGEIRKTANEQVPLPCLGSSFSGVGGEGGGGEGSRKRPIRGQVVFHYARANATGRLLRSRTCARS